jgi:hypothetical protein
MHSERKPPTTPICELGESCRVELKVENEQAARIFQMVRSQCETRWNGEQDIEIDLHHPSLWKAIEKFPGGIQDEWSTFQRILRVWHTLQRLKRDSEG